MRETPPTARPCKRPRRAARLLLAACLAAAFAAASHARQSAKDEAAKAPKPSTTSAVQIIPAPKRVAATGERFRLTRDVRVVVADSKSEDDRFAAGDFADDVRETAGVTLRVGTGGGKRQILVGALSNARVRSAVERAGVSVSADLDDEGYVLIVGPDAVVAAGRTPAGTFYALQTLKQLVRGEGAAAYAHSAP
jgi:hypothetical protein